MREITRRKHSVVVSSTDIPHISLRNSLKWAQTMDIERDEVAQAERASVAVPAVVEGASPVVCVCEKIGSPWFWVEYVRLDVFTEKHS